VERDPPGSVKKAQSKKCGKKPALIIKAGFQPIYR
jgi:hypothetical protein